MNAGLDKRKKNVFIFNKNNKNVTIKYQNSY